MAEPLKYTFRKKERSCVHNDEIRKKGEKRGIIYDYEILEDGKPIAVFSASFGRGYILEDLAGDKIKNLKINGLTNCIEVDSQKEFESTIVRWRHLVPSEADLAARKAEEDERRRLQAIRDKEQQRVSRIRNQAEAMYHLLTHAMDCLPPVEQEIARKIVSIVEATA